MAEILMQRFGDCLRPVDMDGFEAISKIDSGRDVKCNFTQHRNPRFHRMFMGAVRYLFNRRDDYNDYEEFRNDVTIKMGHYKVVLARGKHKVVAKSISFANMDEVKFKSFFNEEFVPIAHQICPNMAEGEIEAFYEILDGESGKIGQRVHPQQSQRKAG